MDRKLIVITGAAGLIGSGVVRYLNQQGHGDNLILVDHLDHPEKVKNLAGKKYWKLITIQGLFPWLKGRDSEIQAFIHLGACSNTWENNTEFLFQNNFRYTQQLALYATQHGHRFIYASSAATYGDGSCGFSDDHNRLDDLTPLNAYGKSKHQFDLWAKQEGLLDHIVGLKYFNVFGPNEGHKGVMASLIFKTVPLIQREKVIRLFRSSNPKQFKDGEQSRDFIYLLDAVRMSCDFLENTRNGIFNIGMGQSVSWNQLAEALFNALQIPLQIEYIDMPKHLTLNYQPYTCADMRKYHQLNTWKYDYTIDTAVQDCVKNYLVVDKKW